MCNNSGFGCNNFWWIIILLFLFCGCGNSCGLPSGNSSCGCNSGNQGCGCC